MLALLVGDPQAGRYTLLRFTTPITMKTFLSLSLWATIATTAFGQLANDNTFSVQIDGKAYSAQPRRIQIGQYWWVTANTIKPDPTSRSASGWAASTTKTGWNRAPT